MTTALGHSVAIEFWRRNSAEMDVLYTEDPESDAGVPAELRQLYSDNKDLIGRIVECAEQDVTGFLSAAKNEMENVARESKLATKRRRDSSYFWTGRVYVGRRGRWSSRPLEMGVIIDTAADDGDFDVAVYLAFPRGARLPVASLEEVKVHFPQASSDGNSESFPSGSVCLETLRVSSFLDTDRGATNLDDMLRGVRAILARVKSSGLLPWALDQRDGKPGRLQG